mmetsp:Transcript_18609/g.33808  ORF Transcript_18609/g.33808 Transcript_18609/m.33808 type:complete len:228 (-) Transcript_18609:205-888(-)
MLIMIIKSLILVRIIITIRTTVKTEVVTSLARHSAEKVIKRSPSTTRPRHSPCHLWPCIATPLAVRATLRVSTSRSSQERGWLERDHPLLMLVAVSPELDLCLILGLWIHSLLLRLLPLFPFPPLPPLSPTSSPNPPIYSQPVQLHRPGSPLSSPPYPPPLYPSPLPLGRFPRRSSPRPSRRTRYPRTRRFIPYSTCRTKPTARVSRTCRRPPSSAGSPPSWPAQSR